MHLCLLCKRNKSDIVLGAIFIAQDFFWWLLSDRRALPGWQAGLKILEVKLFYTRCTIEQSFHLWLVPFFSGSKRSQSWKESRKRMWGEIFTVRRLACKTCFVAMSTYQTVFIMLSRLHVSSPFWTWDLPSARVLSKTRHLGCLC